MKTMISSTANFKISKHKYKFLKNAPHFLCLPTRKRTFPEAETYVLRKGNIRFPHQKRRKYKGKKDLSSQHFQNTFPSSKRICIATLQSR